MFHYEFYEARPEILLFYLLSRKDWNMESREPYVLDAYIKTKCNKRIIHVQPKLVLI